MARNLITDVPGVLVGNAGDAKLGSGVTVIVFESPVTASVDVRGGGPGTRETALLDPAQTVEGIDAIVLSGGSAFGLDAASGVQAWLREQGRGFQVREARVPIVPGAILFDLLSGGDKNWGRYPPYRELGYEAAKQAVWISRSEASVRGSAPRRPTSRVASVRQAQRRAPALLSAQSPQPTPQGA
jgi:L-aminopeptidase/D-esterase-like protein